MNPVFAQVLMAIFRYLLAGLAAYLVGHGIVDKDLADRFIGETASWLLGLVLSGGLVWWAVIRKQAEAYFKRNMAIAGGNSENTTPEQVVAAAVKLQKEGSKPGPIESIPVSTDKGVTKSVVAILLALGLAANIACGGGNRPNLTPVQVAAETASYATDAVQLVDTVVKATSAYSVAQGGRTEQTDAVVWNIEHRLMPRARDLQKVLQLARVAQTPDVQTANQAEIKKALDAYEKAFEEVLGPGKVPDGLSGALASSVVNIRDLIKNIRVTFRFSEA